MRLCKWSFIAIVAALLASPTVQGQTNGDNSPFVPNPLLQDDIRNKPKPKPPKRRKGRKAPTVPVILNGAKAAFDHTSFDFGSIAKGVIVTHYFPVKNEGTDTLIFTQIKPG